MKKRQGFVSNSSSSSFCIMGINVDAEDLFPIYCKVTGIDGSPKMKRGCDCDIDRVQPEGSKFCPQCGKRVLIEEEQCEDIDIMCEKLGIDLSYAGDDGYLVGCDLETHRSTEDLIEELKKSEKKLKELFGDDVDISVHSGVSYG